MNVAAVMVVMAERRLSTFIGDVDGGVGRCFVSGRVKAVIMIMIMGYLRHVLIGNVGELHAVFDAMLVVDHPMHLHRDHDGHAEADTKKAEQLRQDEISPSNFR